MGGVRRNLLTWGHFAPLVGSCFLGRGTFKCIPQPGLGVFSPNWPWLIFRRSSATLKFTPRLELEDVRLSALN